MSRCQWFSLLLHCPKHQLDFIYHTRWQAKQQLAWHVVMCLQLHFLKIVLKHCKQTEFNSFQQSMSWFVKSTLMLVQNGTCYRLMSHPRAIRAQVKLILIGVSLQCWLGAASPLLISKINSNHFQFHSLILQSRLPRGSRHGGGGSILRREIKKMHSCWRGTSLWHFSFHQPTLSTWCCYFPFRCRYLICLAGMQGEEQSWGEQGGLMGIRQEGKQASKPQQKPQTWPRVKHNSLVTCQAASGVIAPNAMDYITLNSTHTHAGHASIHLGTVCF